LRVVAGALSDWARDSPSHSLKRRSISRNQRMATRVKRAAHVERGSENLIGAAPYLKGGHPSPGQFGEDFTHSGGGELGLHRFHWGAVEGG